MWNHEPDYCDDEFEGCDDDYEYWLHCEEQVAMELDVAGASDDRDPGFEEWLDNLETRHDWMYQAA